MIINLKNGIDKLLFGMKQKDVEKLYGQPDKMFEDDEGDTIYLYYDKKLQLKFYADEEYRLGYFVSSHPENTILGEKLISRNINEVKNVLPFKVWEMEDFNTTENHFNESNWLILEAEYNDIIRVEVGAIIKDNDEFDWKFK